MLDHLKQMLIHTPLERPLHRLRYAAQFRYRRRHPELAEIFAEDGRIGQVLARVLKPESNCVDVGAHIGSFLSQILRHAPRGRHMAVEAMPDKAERLMRKFGRNGVDVVHAAVGDAADGEVTLYRNHSRSGFSGADVRSGQGERTEAIAVRCARLDDLVPADRRIDFIKVDVEGGELAVLNGARELIRRCQPIVLFEWTNEQLNAARAKPQTRQLFDLLTGPFGLRVYLLKDWLDNGEPLAFERFREALHYPFKAYNFVAAPAERRRRMSE